MIALRCGGCDSERLMRDGKSAQGKQRYRCGSCGLRSREQPQAKGYSEEFKAQILAAYNERMSLRGIERAFGVSRLTVAKWLKKRPEDAGTAESTASGLS